MTFNLLQREKKYIYAPIVCIFWHLFKGMERGQDGALVTRAGVRSGLQTLGCLTAQEFNSSSGAIFFRL